MVGVDNKLNSDFRFLFNRFKNQIKNNLVKTEELLDYIINSTNIKYIKKFLSHKSYDNPNLTNFDMIIKKIKFKGFGTLIMMLTYHDLNFSLKNSSSENNKNV